MNKKIFFYLFFVLQCSMLESANILYLNGVPSKSHFLWNQAIINRLASRNHYVTVVSFEVDLMPPDNVQYIHLEGGIFNEDDSVTRKDIFTTYEEGAYSSALSFYKYSTLACRGALASKNFKLMWKQAIYSKFDLIIHDFTSGPCLLALMYKFGTHTPLISVSAFNNPQFTTDIVPYKKNIATSPHFATSYGLEMNYFQRLHNFAIHMFDYTYRNFVFKPRINSMVRLQLSSNIPDLSTIERRTVILMLNSNPGVDFTELVPLNIISVGGLHVNEPESLPLQLEQFIRSSKKGCVVVWLGANYGSDVMPEEMQRMFVDTFKSIHEYNFVWRFDSDNIEGYKELPKNVRIRPRINMNDILSHPKVLGFVTHCGLMSIHEATINGVPIVAIPIYSHHHRNWYQMQKAGVGRKMDLHTLNSDDLRETILFVVQNPKFRKNMRARSKHFTETLQKPLEKAIWWIEWVIRNPDSTFMNPPVLDYIRGNSIDVFVFFVVTSLLVMALSGRAIYLTVRVVKSYLEQLEALQQIEEPPPQKKKI